VFLVGFQNTGGIGKMVAENIWANFDTSSLLHFLYVKPFCVTIFLFFRLLLPKKLTLQKIVKNRFKIPDFRDQQQLHMYGTKTG
jgi:predicted permease